MLEPFLTPLSWLAAISSLAGAAGMLIFVVIVAFFTRVPGRFLVLVGSMMTVGAKQGVALYQSLAWPDATLDVQIVGSAVGGLGIAISGLGTVRLALWLRHHFKRQADDASSGANPVA